MTFWRARGLCGPSPQATNVVRGDKYNGKSDVTVHLKFFYYGSPLVCLLMQNDGFEAKLSEKAGDGVLTTTMTMHHKNAPQCFF